jgi:ferredoxin
MPVLNAKSEQEMAILTEAGFIKEENRLSCQCEIKMESVEDLIVEIPVQH